MTLDEAREQLRVAYDEADALGRRIKEAREHLDDLIERSRASEQAIDAAQSAFESLAYAGFGSVGRLIRPPSVQSRGRGS